MTDDQARQIVRVLSAGYPRQEWPDSTYGLWMAELRPLGFAEAMATARSVVRTCEFLTVATFFSELARVREQHLDDHYRGTDDHPTFEAAIAELTEGDATVTEAPTAKRRLGELRHALRGQQWRDRRVLATEAPTTVRPRYDEAYFADSGGMDGQQ
jgi:hypothetical protein